MTLVVGRICQGSLRIESDSKITDPNIASNKNNVFSGLLKSVVLSPDLSISYAGGVETAQKAIEIIYSLKSFNITIVKAELLRIHRDSEMETDFLIASIENQPLLYKISNGKIDVSNTTQWIGDIDGFDYYQRQYLPNLKSFEQKHIFSVHEKAFTSVIENENISSIGGFHVTVFRSANGLRYLSKMTLTMGRSTTVTTKKGKDINPIPWGNAETGSYSSNYLVSENPFKPAIGIHFPMGNFGTLYYPRLTRKVLLFKNVNPFEFVEKIKTEYNLKLHGMVKNGDLMTRI